MVVIPHQSASARAAEHHQTPSVSPKTRGLDSPTVVRSCWTHVLVSCNLGTQLLVTVVSLSVKVICITS